MEKERILEEIRRLAAKNAGVALGQERFAAESGISIGAWRGRYWRTWNEAVKEAGLTPNRPNEAYARESLILRLIALTLKNGRFPTYTDLRMERQADRTFPGHHAFHNLGSLAARIEMVRTYASEHPEHAEAVPLLPRAPSEPDSEQGAATSNVLAGSDGSVYMLRLGKHYKIGKTFTVPRRHREIALELPEKPEIVHVIATDDPTGIEAYWHARFAQRRTNGEWFALSREEIRAFKRRKFM